jgi:quercetin dioxygenase-like cupin family protein
MKPRELTLRGIILGALITTVFTAANVYLGLKVVVQGRSNYFPLTSSGVKTKLISIALFAGVVVTLACPVWGQQPADIDPVTVSPDHYKVLFENDRVRIVEYSIKPGEHDQPHTHPPKVSYVVNGGSLRINLSDTSFVTSDATGSASWRGVVPRHFAENVGATPVRIVLFEVKRVDGQAALPAEDPARNNPSSLRVLLENDSVRVMEAVLPPGLREKQHTHPPYAMFIINGGSVRTHLPDGSTRDASFSTGEARFSEAVTHLNENTGTSTIRIILVELRHR